MTFRTVITAFLTLFLCMSLAGGAFAASKAVNVKFPRGASGTSIDGTIRGSDGVRYLVDVAAGQTMSVQLDTDNPGNYFNITAPGAPRRPSSSVRSRATAPASRFPRAASTRSTST
ncbi:hypothetical protein [Paradevosia shaoguanensis]|uniref:hypothetical protein n=1 Tax=Paradevosia shaoguanensis TaxID=1335043 RepID=UPI003C76303D